MVMTVKMITGIMNSDAALNVSDLSVRIVSLSGNGVSAEVENSAVVVTKQSK